MSGRRSAGRSFDWRVVVGLAAVLVFAGGAAFALMSGGSDDSDGSPASSQAATEGVQVLAGAPHTVQHSTAPLPSASAPTADGLPTLVWFSGTWCTYCHQMEPFAYETAGQFASRLHFVEKSVDHDRDAVTRYGVRGTPTFVLIDAAGDEIGRFSFQRDAAAFAAAIEQTLAKAGA